MDAESGRIIYSVGKQADFAATVTKGALANSAIGQVIKPLVDSKNSKALIVQDFSAYASAYNDQVVFLALALDKMLAQFRGSIHGVSDASTSDCWISGRTGCSRGHFGAKHSNRAGKYCSAG